MPNGSGNLANALDHIAGEGFDDDFLTGDDVTIAQIHSLACKLQPHEHCRIMFKALYTFLLTLLHTNLSTDIHHSKLPNWFPLSSLTQPQNRQDQSLPHPLLPYLNLSSTTYPHHLHAPFLRLTQ